MISLLNYKYLYPHIFAYFLQVYCMIIANFHVKSNLKAHVVGRLNKTKAKGSVSLGV